jgi:hypothetical protein
LAQTLEQLMRDPGLRSRLGRAGRARVEQHFRIEHTVAPLVELLQKTSVVSQRNTPHRSTATVDAAIGNHQIAYLIDRWPDKDLPLLEHELQQIKRRNVPIVPVVCELNSAARLTNAMEQLALRLEFLPDAMVMEAEWRANPTLAQRLEEERAQEDIRAPSAIFLRQARLALVVRRMLEEKKVSHVHATSSRALVCALILQELIDVTVSATVEPRPELPLNWIESALRKCEGGRLSDRKLLHERSSSFVVDEAAFCSTPRKVVGLLGKNIGIDLTTGASFWQEWAGLLVRWSGEKA